VLLERKGEVVTREELRTKLWPSDTFVDFDHGLNAAVNKLRSALGDSADSPRHVETLLGRGYRFVGNVETPTPTPLAQPKPRQRLVTTRKVLAAGLAVSATALFSLYYGHSLRSKAVQPLVIPAVTNVGEKYSPSLSPDGQQLAFAWNGGSGPYFSI